MPAQALGHYPVLPIIADCPWTPAETGWGAWGAKSSSRVLNKFHKMVQSLSSWNSDTLPCVQMKWSKMDLPGYVPRLLHLLPLSLGILSSLGFCLHNLICLFVGKWSLDDLTLFHLTFLFHSDARAQHFPGAGYIVWEKESRHSLLWGC